jgi:hypothetical protein
MMMSAVMSACVRKSLEPFDDAASDAYWVEFSCKLCGNSMCKHYLCVHIFKAVPCAARFLPCSCCAPAACRQWRLDA